MYIPKHFIEKDKTEIKKFIRENGFATLITCHEPYPQATHIPIELIDKKGEEVLWGHIAKANPQSKIFKNEPDVLVIFLSSVHHYISSSWYEKPNAPTWNYLSVHVYGKLKILEGETLWQSLEQLTDKYEKISKNPISVDGLPQSVKKQIDGLVGFEISIKKIETAFKLSQNRNPMDFSNIIEELKGLQNHNAKEMARLMENKLK